MPEASAREPGIPASSEPGPERPGPQGREREVDHLQRVLDEMASRDVDALLLGREDNARYVSGARRLWLAGTRPFAPGCVVVRATGAIHLLSITDEGMPAGVAPDHLYPITWNPLNLLSTIAEVPGVRDAARVGVDGLTPLFAQLLPAVLPECDIVDGDDLMRAARRVKSPDDVEAIRAAIRVAEDALGAAIEALRPGVRERDLQGVFGERAAAQGVTTPAFEGVFFVVDREHRRYFSSDRVIEDGDLVAMSVGVLAGGWVGALARTRPCGEPGPDHSRRWSRWWAEWAALVDRMGPGGRPGGLRARAGVDLTAVGMGEETLADDEVLVPGMVVALELWHAGLVGAETMLITDSGHDVLTRATYAATGAPSTKSRRSTKRLRAPNG